MKKLLLLAIALAFAGVVGLIGEAAKAPRPRGGPFLTALAALVTAAAPDIGNQHARSLRDGLRSLQLAFREASAFPDAPGDGPGEKFTGSVV